MGKSYPYPQTVYVEKTKLQSPHAANLAKKTLHLKEVINAAWRITEMSSSVWKDSVFVSSPCSNSFHIPQDYNFFKLYKKKKKAHSSQVYNLNAKFLPRFTFSSSVLNHWKWIEWGVLSGEHCCSPTNRTSVWSSLQTFTHWLPGGYSGEEGSFRPAAYPFVSSCYWISQEKKHQYSGSWYCRKFCCPLDPISANSCFAYRRKANRFFPSNNIIIAFSFLCTRH